MDAGDPGSGHSVAGVRENRLGRSSQGVEAEDFMTKVVGSLARDTGHKALCPVSQHATIAPCASPNWVGCAGMVLGPSGGLPLLAFGGGAGVS